MSALLTDKVAMDRIAAVMSDTEWSADTLDRIADIVRDTGREITDDFMEEETK